MELVQGIYAISGCMFAGKTEELIRRSNRVKRANLEVLVFKPTEDVQSNGVVKSHDKKMLEAIEIADPIEILELALLPFANVPFAAIDEVQFFDIKIIEVCEILANEGVHVVVAGLNLDFRGEPFGPMKKLICLADEVETFTAICAVDGCMRDATRTQRIVNGEPADYSDPIIMVGAQEKYEGRCRMHHDVPDIKNQKAKRFRHVRNEH